MAKKNYSEKDQRLILAVKNNDEAEFRRLLESDVVCDDNYVFNACLMEAVKNHNLELVKYIFENDPDQEFNHLLEGDADAPTFFAATRPLHVAARQGDLPMVKLLLKLGANPFAMDEYGGNVVATAIYSGNIELVRFLIEDCSLPWQNICVEGLTPAHHAVMSQNPSMFGYILSLGALQYLPPKYLPLADDFDEPFPFENFIRKNFEYYKKPELCRTFLTILKRYKRHKNDPTYNNPLDMLARGGKLEKLKELAATYLWPVDWQRFLYLAMEYGRMELYRYIVDEKHIEVPLDALEFAVEGGNVELVRELHQQHQLCIYGNGIGGFTLLEAAIYNGVKGRGTVEVVRYLIEKCQLDRFFPIETQNPLYWACKAKRLDIVRYLVDERGYDCSDPKHLALHGAVYAGSLPKLTEYLWKHGADRMDPATCEERGFTYFTEAVFYEDIPAVTFFLEHGVDPSARDGNGKNAFDWLRENKKSNPVMQKLLENATLNTRSESK